MRSHRAIDAIRREDDLRILRAFEDVLVHAAVALLIAAVAAGRVHRHFARDLAVGRIEADRAVRELEVAVYRVQRRGQLEFDGGVRGVRIEHHLLAPCRARKRQRRQEKWGTHRWKDSSV